MQKVVHGVEVAQSLGILDFWILGFLAPGFLQGLRFGSRVPPGFEVWFQGSFRVWGLALGFIQGLGFGSSVRPGRFGSLLGTF